MNKEQYRELHGLHLARGEQQYLLEVFGDTLAKQEGYSVGGMDAIYIYLIKKHSWLPRDVVTMSHDHIRLALHAELKGWLAPEEACVKTHP